MTKQVTVGQVFGPVQSAFMPCKQSGRNGLIMEVATFDIQTARVLF